MKIKSAEYVNEDKVYRSSDHLTYSCQYHVVFCPKYRRKILVGKYKERVIEVFKEVAAKRNFKIIEMEVMPDHVHILLSIDDFGETAGASPRPTVDGCVRIVKSISARRFNKVDNTPGRKVFQTSFYDEIIGSSAYYEEVWRYIDENPMKWLITKQKNNK